MRALGTGREVGRPPECILFQTEGLHRRGGLGQQWGDIGIGPIGQDQAIVRHGIDELAKGSGDFVQVLVNIRVVEFDIVDD